jgi:hypothetical protein
MCFDGIVMVNWMSGMRSPKMGELARQRRARDLWISRGHIYASLVGAAVMVCSAFAVGYDLGARTGLEAKAVTGSFSGQVASADLVELLARVETSAVRDGGVQALTFPSTLEGEVVGPREHVGGSFETSVRAVWNGGPAGTPVADERPEGRYTVEVQRHVDVIDARELRDVLRGVGMPAWVGVDRVDGDVQYRVSIGGFSGRRSAEDALAKVSELIPAAHPRLIER